jgi:HEAT repeat protein
MKSKKQLLFLLLTVWMAATTRTYAQTGEVENLFHDLEAMDAGTQAVFDKADPVLERLVRSNRENVVQSLPVILRATSDPHLSVRRVAASALYQITTRPDGKTLLSAQTATFTALLTDPDIPIRRITGFAIANLQLDASSPLVPVLQSYLARQDAVSTIGAGVATLLMKAAPNDANSTNAVVQFMRRKDQTSGSRSVLLNAIKNVANSHSLEIGKEVAGYADDPDEQTSVLAIETLQSMGKDVAIDNQPSLSRIAADNRRTPSVRAAARKVLTSAQ